MEGRYEGWLRIQIGDLDQWIILVSTTFWRISMVFRLSGDESRLLGYLAASWCESVL
jgi:hypothetical protein